MSGTLYVVATTLGNLADMSPRAVRTLQEVDLIACEDTRHASKLLRHFQVKRPSVSYHDHNESSRTPQLLKRLEAGEKIALLADAGTPLISDPGYRLVRACREAGICVVPIPGPSAAIAALSVSGVPSDRFCFAGFPARRGSARKRQLKALAELEQTLIFYLSPHRLVSELEDLAETLGDREAFLIREMTKLHETAYFGRLNTILEDVRSEETRGEYTLVVAGAKEIRTAPAVDPVAYLAGLEQVRGLSRKAALRRAADELGMSRRELYDLVVKARGTQ